MSYATIDALRSQLGAPPATATSPAYAAKMLHPLPVGKALDRSAFILEAVKGKRVLEFGATGPMHDAVVKAAATVLGVDREDDFESGVMGFDLDDVSEALLPVNGPFDLVLCGEVIEHLSNPGWFLTRLRRQFPTVPVLITVPNAFTVKGRSHLEAGVENVNIDHVSWYSPRTMRTLLERAGYAITDFAWYGGRPPYSEGLIVVAETQEN